MNWDLIWDKIFHVADFFSSPWLFVYMIGVVCVVFVVCTLIELIRKKTISVPLSNLLYKFILFFTSIFTKKEKANNTSTIRDGNENEK